MKKILSLLLSIVLLLTVMPFGAVNATSNPTIVVDQVIGKAGDTVTVNVSLKNNPGIIAAKLLIGYDSDVLELTGRTPGVGFGGMAFPKSLTTNPYFANWVDSINPDNTTNGTFVTLTFKIKDTAVSGVSPITVTYDPEDVYNENWDNVTFEVVNGGVDVEGVPTASVVVDQVEGAAGDTVTVNVSLENNPGIISAKLFIGYDSDVLELTGRTPGVGFGGMAFPKSLTVNPYYANWIDSINPDNTTSGTFVTLTFKIKDTAVSGFSPITVTYDPEDVYNEDWEDVYFDVEDGGVDVKDANITCAGRDTIYWDGSIAEGIATGTGTKVDPYVIKTAAEFAWLVKNADEDGTAATAHKSSGKYYEIAENIGAIVLQPQEFGADILALKNADEVQAYFEDINFIFNGWPSQGWEQGSFCGIFDGNGATVYGLYQTSSNNAGLFSTVEAGAVIKNIALKNSYLTSTASNYNLGGLAAVSSGSSCGLKNNGAIWFDNCVVANNYMYNTSTSHDRTGVIIGASSDMIYIENCLVYGNNATYGDGVQAAIWSCGQNAQVVTGNEIIPEGLVVKDDGNDTPRYYNVVRNSIILGTKPYDLAQHVGSRFNDPRCYEYVYTDSNVATDVFSNGASMVAAEDQLKTVTLGELATLKLGDAWYNTASYPELKVFHDDGLAITPNNNGTHGSECSCGAKFVSPCTFVEGKCSVCEADLTCGSKRTIYWNGAVATGFADTSAGTKADPIIINSAEELAYLVSCKADVTAGKYFEIAEDIGTIVLQPQDVAAEIIALDSAAKVQAMFEDISYIFVEWPEKGWEQSCFAGQFNGNGVNIYGLYIVSDSNAGLFSTVDAGAAIHNVSLLNSYLVSNSTSANYQVGGIAAVTSYTTYGANAMGVVWVDSCVVGNCYMRNDAADLNRSGVIFGAASSDAVVIDNCLVYGNDARHSATKGDHSLEMPLINLASNGVIAPAVVPEGLDVKIQEEATANGDSLYYNSIRNTISFGTDLMNTNISRAYRRNDPATFENCYTDAAAGTVTFLDGEWTYEDSQIKSVTLETINDNDLGAAWIKTSGIPALRAYHTPAVTDNGDGTHSENCDCGLVGSKTAHTFENGSCIICGSGCQHVASDIVEENLEPTCTANGYYDTVVYCSVCGVELSRERDVIEALGHTAGTAVVENRVEATCTDNGSYDTVVYCSVCDAELSRITTTIDTTNHTAGAAVVENRVEATCTANGSYDNVVYCSVCGAELSRETVTIEKTPHYVNVSGFDGPVYVENNDINYPFSINDGVYTSTNKSNNSSSTYKITAENDCTIELTYGVSSENNYDFLTIKRNGVQVDKISGSVSNRTTAITLNTGDTITVTYSKDSSQSSGSDSGWFSFTVESEVTLVPAHEVEPTCNDILCYYCNAVVVNGTGHTAGTAVKENYVQEDCVTNRSYDLVSYCTVCGEEASRRTVITKYTSGHKLNSNGVCSECGFKYNTATIYVDTVTGSVGDTVNVNVNLTQNPGFVSAKLKLAYDSNVLELVAYTPGAAFSGMAFGPKENNPFVANWVNSVNPDVTANGAFVTLTFKIKDTAKSGFSPITVTYDSEDLYNANFDNVYFDVVNSGVNVVSCEHNNTKIAQENHNGPTCTENGYYDEVVYCLDCELELSREIIILEPLGHKMSDIVIENYVDATCITNGSYDEVLYCDVCGMEQSRNTVIIPATGHTFDEVVPYVAPNCQADGNVAYKQCLSCGNNLEADADAYSTAYIYDVVLSKIPHSYNADGDCIACGYNPFVQYLSYKIANGAATITGCDQSFTGEMIIPKTIEGYMVKIIAIGAFKNCTSMTSVKIPNGVIIVDNSAFSGCRSLTSITIPDSVTSIGSSAFYNCTSLTSITIPDSVTSIGSGAFLGCTSLTSITIPDSVTSIGDDAFSLCTSLTSITIGSSVTSIGCNAFYNCTSLTSITIPDSVRSIGYSAFSGCTSLTSITIPDSVTSIYSGAFRGCTSLKSVYINSLDAWFNIDFYDSNSNPLNGGADLYVNGEKLVDLVIPHYESYINSYIFNGCLSLESVTIHNGVYAIGEYAFNNCDNIMQINYYGTQAEWNAITKGAYNYPLHLATLNLIECENHVYDGTSDKVCNVCAKERAYVTGDLNGYGGDGVINNKDLGVLMQYLNGWDYTDIVLGAADINGDGAVNNRDYGLLMRYLNGWDIELK